jgi:hypothetical protein
VIQSKLLRILSKTMIASGHLLSWQSRILGTFSIWVTKTQQEPNSPRAPQGCNSATGHATGGIEPFPGNDQHRVCHSKKNEVKQVINNRKEQNYFRNQDVISGFSLVADEFVASADAKPSMSDSNNGLTTKSEKSIMNVEETARFMRMSVSWVYKNSADLGGRKLGGSLFFPSKEDLYERLFSKRDGGQVRFRVPEKKVHQCVAQNKNRSKTGRSKKTRGVEKPKAGSREANRHGLLGPCESSA